MATITVEAEYDGRVLIPKEPLNLPVGQSVRLIISTGDVEARLKQLDEALRYFQEHPVRRSLSDEELRREVIYDD
ncbi:MAG: DUF104 domain-containing protein [Fimbriimonadales bacterium]|nr:DUF104 domain-containing protein [Fimbriimonadales bacterium]